MNAAYLKTLSEILAQVRPRLATTHGLRFGNCFGAVAGYANGNIFISCGRFGTALKLPSGTLKSLLAESGVRPLQYFPNGHVKKDYAVLSERILQDPVWLKKLVDQSLRFVKQETVRKP